MTQAYNLAILANAVNTSGQLNVGTNATGTLPVANGGTGQTTYTNGQLLIGNTTGNTLTKANLTAGSGISITNGAGSITIAASGSGTVTSVATGNGLQGGTITTTGTLSVACPTHNTVGSYVFAGRQYNVSDFSMTFGTNYAGGNGYDSIGGASCRVDSLTSWGIMNLGSSLSGTWKWMAGNTGTIGGPNGVFGLACRVS